MMLDNLPRFLWGTYLSAIGVGVAHVAHSPTLGIETALFLRSQLEMLIPNPYDLGSYGDSAERDEC